MNARADSDLEMAFATFSQQRVGAVLLGTSNFYVRRLEQLAALAARQALPTMFGRLGDAGRPVLTAIIPISAKHERRHRELLDIRPPELAHRLSGVGQCVSFRDHCDIHGECE